MLVNEQKNLKIFAHFIKTKGLNGEIIIKLTKALVSIPKQFPSFFIQIEDKSLVPYKVTKFNLSTANFAVIVLKNVSSEMATKLIKFKTIYIEQVDMDKLMGQEIDNWRGFSIQSLNNYNAIVEDVIHLNGQIIIQTIINNKEILLPAPSQLIKSIDIKNKKIDLIIPDGLI